MVRRVRPRAEQRKDELHGKVLLDMRNPILCLARLRAQRASALREDAPPIIVSFGPTRHSVLVWKNANSVIDGDESDGINYWLHHVLNRCTGKVGRRADASEPPARHVQRRPRRAGAPRP